MTCPFSLLAIHNSRRVDVQAKLDALKKESKFNVSLEWLLDDAATRICDYEIFFKVRLFQFSPQRHRLTDIVEIDDVEC